MESAAFWLLFIVMVVCFIGWKIIQNIEARDEQSSLENHLREKYNPNELFVSIYDSSIIALLYEKSVLVLGHKKECIEYNFDQIASVEIIRNGGTLTSTSRGSQLVGAAVGGIAFGGVGALIGGLSGSKSTIEKIQKLEIKLTIEDNENPIYRVLMFEWEESKSGVKADNYVLKPILEKTDRLYALITTAMRRAEEDKVNTAKIETLSVSDQIAKLWELKESGALLESEFVAAKERILLNQ